MDALRSEQFDDVLAETAQSDAGAAEFRPSSGYAKDVALRRIGLHTQQQVGGGQMKETERVRLDHLRQIQHAPQLCGRMRNAH